MPRKRGTNYLSHADIAIMRQCYANGDKAIVAATLVDVTDRTAYKYYNQFKIEGVEQRSSSIRI